MAVLLPALWAWGNIVRVRVLITSGAVLVVALAVALAGHFYFALSTADTIALAAFVAAAVGAAAALIPVLEGRSRGEVTRPYFELGEDEGWIKFHFEAYVLNSGGSADILREVECLFYHVRTGTFPISLIFGAREVEQPTGHILPHDLRPGQTYFVEAREHFSVDSNGGKRLKEEYQNRDDYVLRCRFIFDKSRAVVVRVHPHDLNPVNAEQAEIKERQLGLELK